MKNIFVKDVRNKISQPLTIREGENIDTIALKFIKSPINRTIYIVNKRDEFVGYINLNLFLDRILIDMLDSSFFFKNGINDAYSFGKLSKIFLAKDLMRIEDITVKDEDTLADSIRIMKNYKIQELPVVDSNNKIIGDLNTHEIVLAWKGNVSIYTM